MNVMNYLKETYMNPLLNIFTCRLVTDPSGSHLIPDIRDGGMPHTRDETASSPKWDDWKIIVHYKAYPSARRDFKRANPI